MAVTETSHQSWFSRLGDSVKGILIGSVIFILGFPLLWWNEGRAVRTANGINYAEGHFVEADSAKVDSANEGKLVHMTGLAQPKGELADDIFGVKVGAIRFERHVQMFQVEEVEERSTKKNLGGSTDTVTTYSLATNWHERVIDSSRFHEKPAIGNPPSMPVPAYEKLASEVAFGAFSLNQGQIARIGGEEPVNLADVPIPAGIADSVKPSSASFLNTHKYRCFKNGNEFYLALARPLQVMSGVPATPQIGDLRISFQAVKPHEVSILAQQKGSTFTAFSNGNDTTTDNIMDGTKTAQEMFTAARKSNKILTWILRFVGYFMMGIGLSLVLGPLSVLADVLPFLGNLIGKGAKFIAFLLALPFTFLTIGVAWLAYRPVLGISLLVAAAVLIVLFIIRKRKAAPKAAPAA